MVLSHYKGKHALDSGNSVVPAAGAAVDAAAGCGGELGYADLDRSEGGLQGQVTKNWSTTGVVSNHHTVNVAVRIEVERRHRYVHLNTAISKL